MAEWQELEKKQDDANLVCDRCGSTDFWFYTENNNNVAECRECGHKKYL